MYAKKRQVTSGMFHGVSRESFARLFHTMSENSNELSTITIVGKANRMLGFLKRNCAGLVDSNVLLRLYCSLVRSHLCYCSQVWAPQSVINQLILIEQVQRRATRFIIGRDRDLCYKDRLIKLNLLPLNYCLEYLDLVFFYKSLKGDVMFARHFDEYFSFLRGALAELALNFISRQVELAPQIAREKSCDYLLIIHLKK